MTKERKISISMDAVERNGRTVSVLKIGKDEIGVIEPRGEKFMAFPSGSDGEQLFKSEEDAVNYVISTYHLHQA